MLPPRGRHWRPARSTTTWRPRALSSCPAIPLLQLVGDLGGGHCICLSQAAAESCLVRMRSDLAGGRYASGLHASPPKSPPRPQQKSCSPHGAPPTRPRGACTRRPPPGGYLRAPAPVHQPQSYRANPPPTCRPPGRYGAHTPTAVAPAPSAPKDPRRRYAAIVQRPGGTATKMPSRSPLPPGPSPPNLRQPTRRRKAPRAAPTAAP